MVIYLTLIFVLTGGISIFSLCRAAGKADEMEEELFNRRDIIN